MHELAIAVLVGHFILLLILCSFGLHRLSMAVRWLKHRHKTDPVPQARFEHLPALTVQIPLYNEKHVAERIIDACAAIDYPADKLQIQIVDDSTDETLAIVAARVALHQQKGVNIHHVTREIRTGFKAGALKDAMTTATGEFIAIFDADFIPTPNLLKEQIHHFTAQRLGMLQFRWSHLNQRDSLLTKAQAIMIDAHFALEQSIRCKTGRLFNFNGTAGIWRTETIIDAGHWSADTLTEDLDLSYRAQLRGWEMRYLNDVACDSELPANMSAFKSQQFRWSKGGTQVMIKLLSTVWKAPLKLSTKIESTFHLGNNLAYLVMLLDTLVFLVPSLIIRQHYDLMATGWIDIPLLLASTGGHLAYLYTGQIALGKTHSYALGKLPALMLLGIQMTTNNSKAAFEALRGIESPFVRTPKTGETDNAKVKPKKIYTVKTPTGALFEFALAIAYLSVTVWALSLHQWLMLPFVMLLTIGFFTTALHSLKGSSIMECLR